MIARVRVVAICALVSAGAALAEPAPRMKPEARLHLERGLKLYQHQKYDEAIDELREGLAIDPQPDILYALGQAERKRGHCDRAIEYYQSCLALVKDPSAAAALRVQIERCRVEQGDSAPPPAPSASPPANNPPPGPPSSPAPTQPFPSSTTAPASGSAAPPSSASSARSTTSLSAAPQAQSSPSSMAPVSPSASPQLVAASADTARPWHRDPLGATTLALGLAGVAAGGALLGVAQSRLDDAVAGYQQYADARGAPTLWTAGVITLAAGGALVAIGVIRFAIVGARHAPTWSSVSKSETTRQAQKSAAASAGTS